MPVIRISDETWEAMKEWAVPLEDTPDDVVRRLIGMAREHRGRSADADESALQAEGIPTPAMAGRLAKGLRVPEEEYKIPILQTVHELGGSARAGDVLAAVERKMKDQLSNVDYQPLPKTGEARWRNTAMWARKRLVQGDLLRGDSPRGVWELSAKGADAIARRKAQ